MNMLFLNRTQFRAYKRENLTADNSEGYFLFEFYISRYVQI